MFPCGTPESRVGDNNRQSYDWEKKMDGQKYTGKNILVYEMYRNVLYYATWIFRVTSNRQAGQSQNNKPNLTLTAQTNANLPTN